MCVAVLEIFHAVRVSSDKVASFVGPEHCIYAVEETARGRKAHGQCSLAERDEAIDVYVHLVNTCLDVFVG